jgi:hypothetical protein
MKTSIPNIREETKEISYTENVKRNETNFINRAAKQR